MNQSEMEAEISKYRAMVKSLEREKDMAISELERDLDNALQDVEKMRETINIDSASMAGKDAVIAAKDAEISELREKWHEALNIADSFEKCASIERQTEALLKKNDVIFGLRKQIAKLHECLREAVDYQCGKRKCEECFFCEIDKREECIAYKWRKALEGAIND